MLVFRKRAERRAPAAGKNECGRLLRRPRSWSSRRPVVLRWRATAPAPRPVRRACRYGTGWWRAAGNGRGRIRGRGRALRLAARRRGIRDAGRRARSEEHTSELQSLMRISYAVFCLKKKKKQINMEIELAHIKSVSNKSTRPE